jgi:hypothetical protein
MQQNPLLLQNHMVLFQAFALLHFPSLKNARGGN